MLGGIEEASGSGLNTSGWYSLGEMERERRRVGCSGLEGLGGGRCQTRERRKEVWRKRYVKWRWCCLRLASSVPLALFAAYHSATID